MSPEHTETPPGHTPTPPASPTPGPGPRRPSERYRRKLGGRLKTLRGALQTLGDESWLDGLGDVGGTLRAWRAEILADLGGPEAVSAQERAVVELATKTYLLLESIDRWLMSQRSLINQRRRHLFPVVLQRQQLADSLVRHLSALGLKRRARRVSLPDYMSGRAPKEP